MESLVDAKWLIAPWQIQVALGSGYAAYMAAYTGIRGHHQGVDVTFRAIAFGLVATAVLMVVPASRPVLSIALAFVTAVAAGASWRRFGMTLWMKLLRNSDVTWGDDTPNAWVRMISNQDHYVSQISVLTTDNRWLRCDDTASFLNAPLGPCILGTNGDIILYPTHVQESGKDPKQVNVVDDYHGTRATYISASQIKQVNIRHKPIKRT